MKEKRIGLLAVVIIVAALIVGIIHLSPKTILKVDTTRVYEPEAMVYIAMAAKQFEEIGGEHIWELSFDETDAQTTVEEVALETLLQVKLLNYHGTSLSSEEQAEIERKLPELAAYLGEDWIEAEGISEKTLRTVLQENYLVWKYQESVAYDEEEIEAAVEEALSDYQNAEERGMLDSVRFDVIIYYNGVLNGDEWVRYPTETWQEQLQKIQEVQQRLQQGEDFEAVAAEYGEHRTDEEQMLFYCGIWQDAEPTGYYYRGQLNSALAGKLFKLEAGVVSDPIETPYGAMIVRVQAYHEAEAQDREAFLLLLDQAETRIRQQYIDASRQTGLQNEVAQLKRETDIELWEERWASVLQAYWEKNS
jgi:hypothetical protein